MWYYYYTPNLFFVNAFSLFQQKNLSRRTGFLCAGEQSVDLLLDLGSLTDAVTQVVQLGAAHLTNTDDLDAGHVGGVQGEGLLHAATVGNTADGEGLGDAAAVLSDNGTLEDLDSLAVALFDLVLDTNGVTDLEGGDSLLQLLIGKSLNQIHDYLASLKSGVFMQSDAADHP